MQAPVLCQREHRVAAPPGHRSAQPDQTALPASSFHDRTEALDKSRRIHFPRFPITAGLRKWPQPSSKPNGRFRVRKALRDSLQRRVRQHADMKPMDLHSLHAQSLKTSMPREFTGFILNGDHIVLTVPGQGAEGMVWPDPRHDKPAGIRNCREQTQLATPGPDLPAIAEPEQRGDRPPRSVRGMKAANHKAVSTNSAWSRGDDSLRIWSCRTLGGTLRFAHGSAESVKCHLRCIPETPTLPSVVSWWNEFGLAQTITEQCTSINLI